MPEVEKINSNFKRNSIQEKCYQTANTLHATEKYFVKGESISQAWWSITIISASGKQG
jgi:hypothetical protein